MKAKKLLMKTKQEKIKDCILSIDIIIDLENKKLELLKKHKKGLMQLLSEENKIK